MLRVTKLQVRMKTRISTGTKRCIRSISSLCCIAKTLAEVATDEIEVIQTLDLQRKRALMNDDTMLLPGDFGGKLELFDSAAWCWEQSGPSGVPVTQHCQSRSYIAGPYMGIKPTRLDEEDDLHKPLNVEVLLIWI